MATLSELKTDKDRLQEQLTAARKADNPQLVSELKGQLEQVQGDIALERGLPQTLGSLFGRQVQRHPFQLRRTRREVAQELTPFFERRTREQQRVQFRRPLRDIARVTEREVPRIAGLREARDITEGQERRAQFRQFGQRGISASPAAQRLGERLQRIQAARTEVQERGFRERAQDLERQRKRTLASRKLFQKERKRQLKQLIGRETAATAFRQLPPRII